jgi:hypothetical protein
MMHNYIVTKAQPCNTTGVFRSMLRRTEAKEDRTRDALMRINVPGFLLRVRATLNPIDTPMLVWFDFDTCKELKLIPAQFTGEAFMRLKEKEALEWTTKNFKGKTIKLKMV